MNPLNYFDRPSSHDSPYLLKDVHRQYEARALQEALDRLSSSLVRHGVAPGQRIAVLCGKSASQVIAMLSIWKLGAVYVPISNLNPQTRVDYILEDCDIDCVLIDDAATSLFHFTGRQVIAVLAELEAPVDPPKQAPRAEVAAGDTSYIIYTSGSTGKPKGVVITYGALNRLMRTADDAFHELDRSAIFLQVLDFSFDVSLWDVLLWIVKGGTLVIVDIGQNVFKLVKMIQQYRPTYLCNAAPTYSLLLNAQDVIDSQNFSFVKTVITTASYCPPKVATHLLRLFPEANVFNCYGPTETTVYCCWTPIARAPIPLDRPLSIGHPLPECEAYLYDGLRALPAAEVPENIERELCIAGPQVFKEYWKAPELTAQKTLITEDGKRAYRTGDLVTRQGDRFFYFGRTDDTIKIRGYRVNLGEIELCLNALEFIASCAVLAVPDENEALHLTAVFTAKKPSSIQNPDQLSAVRARCQNDLPSYMVPERFLAMASLPLNQAGKIDRRELQKWIAAGDIG